MPKSPQEREVFRGYLGSLRLRMTRERRQILDEVASMDGHFAAEDLWGRLANRRLPVSRATVYRALEHLVASGLVQKVYVSDHDQRKALFERAHGREHHEHMHCVSCGGILEFTDDAIERRQKEVCRRMGFTPLRHSLRIEGFCSSCRESR